MTDKKELNTDWQMIRDQAAKLAELICSSTEYLRFQDAREKLAESEWAEELDALRQTQMALHMSDMLGELDDDEMEDCDRRYVELASQPVIGDYLHAEGRFFRLLADVEHIFTERLDLAQPDDMERGCQFEHDINFN